MKKLSRDFFNRNSVKAARELPGKYLIKKDKKGILAAKIVEVEAYRGINDPASHACRKKTPRNSIMFGKPGFGYVYFCYGNYFMFNIVTEEEGKAGAVLIRAIEPVKGIEAMRKYRGIKKSEGFEFKLGSGPGRLAMAMNITKRENGADLCGSGFYVAEGKKEKIRIKSSPRIGIKQGLDKKWRFYIKGNKHVSGNK